MGWPKLTILLLTYSPSVDHPRASYAEQTLRSVLDMTVYSGQRSVHIADDGSPQEHRDRLTDIAGGYANVRGVSVSNSERRGYGANFNLATQAIHADGEIVLPLEDDWVVGDSEYALNFDPLVDTLVEGWNRIGCIRLGYLGFTNPLRGEIIECPTGGPKYLLFDPDSPETHVFAGHPRLETVGWQRTVGPWPEGVDPGTTEFLVAKTAAARRGVAWPLDLVMPAFAHIGTVQARSDQS